MRALLTTLVLLAPPALAAPVPEPREGSIIEGSSSSTSTSTSTSTPTSARPRIGASVPTQAVVDKLGMGDRLLLAGDQRGALFAYQDAVYAQPTYAPARVRLGRAYLALRYPEQAISQAEAALAADPDSVEARKLLEDARAAPSRPALPGAAAAAAATAPATVSSSADDGSARPPPRVFKLSPESDPGVAPKAPAPVTRAPAAVTTAAEAGGAAPVPAFAPAPVAIAAPRDSGPRAPAQIPAQRQLATQHYRTALGFLQSRDWARAVGALSDAILADPTLAVAYSARGSAEYGLGRYRDAADDYAAALRLDPRLATPIYGLAECYRVLGDAPKAAEMYERYAQSTAPDVRDDLRALAVKRAKEPGSVRPSARPPAP